MANQLNLATKENYIASCAAGVLNVSKAGGGEGQVNAEITIVSKPININGGGSFDNSIPATGSYMEVLIDPLKK